MLRTRSTRASAQGFLSPSMKPCWRTSWRRGGSAYNGRCQSRSTTRERGSIHHKQVLTYLRLANLHLGLLINFGANLIKDGITLIVHELPE